MQLGCVQLPLRKKAEKMRGNVWEEKVLYSASLQRKKAHVNIFVYSEDLILLDANCRKTDIEWREQNVNTLI